MGIGEEAVSNTAGPAGGVAEAPGYRPNLATGAPGTLRRWHETAYAQVRQESTRHVRYLGREFVVPREILAPTEVSDLLGNAVLDEVRPSDRVLEVGTGCGLNAILAASRSADVVGVDLNSCAIGNAAANAALNGVSSRTRFYCSDVFDAVEGRFDLVIFDPRFRWLAPRDSQAPGITDDDYQALTRFVTEVRDHLTSGGRVLLFFATLGDLEYVYRLTEQAGLEREVVASRELTRHGVTVAFSTFRLVPRE